MYANQILKGLTNSIPEYSNAVRKIIPRCHQFYFGHYKNIVTEVKKRTYKRKLFMGPLGHNIKLPYEEFLLCFNLGEHSKMALLVKQFCANPDGLAIDYLMSMGDKKWTLLPLTRVYIFNTSLEEIKELLSEVDRRTSLPPDGIPLLSQDLSKSNTFVISHTKNAEEESKNIQKTVSSVLNYFLLLYNQKYIVTETVVRQKSRKKKRMKNARVMDYKILSVKLPKGGKKYRYCDVDSTSKGIMPFTQVPATWKTYTKDAPLFGNPKLVGDFWVPSHVRGSKQAGFISKDYCVQ